MFRRQPNKSSEFSCKIRMNDLLYDSPFAYYTNILKSTQDELYPYFEPFMLKFNWTPLMHFHSDDPEIQKQRGTECERLIIELFKLYFPDVSHGGDYGKMDIYINSVRARIEVKCRRGHAVSFENIVKFHSQIKDYNAYTFIFVDVNDTNDIKTHILVSHPVIIYVNSCDLNESLMLIIARTIRSVYDVYKSDEHNYSKLTYGIHNAIHNHTEILQKLCDDAYESIVNGSILKITAHDTSEEDVVLYDPNNYVVESVTSTNSNTRMPRPVIVKPEVKKPTLPLLDVNMMRNAIRPLIDRMKPLPDVTETNTNESVDKLDIYRNVMKAGIRYYGDQLSRTVNDIFVDYDKYNKEEFWSKHDVYGPEKDYIKLCSDNIKDGKPKVKYGEWKPTSQFYGRNITLKPRDNLIPSNKFVNNESQPPIQQPYIQTRVQPPQPPIQQRPPQRPRQASVQPHHSKSVVTSDDKSQHVTITEPNAENTKHHNRYKSNIRLQPMNNNGTNPYDFSKRRDKVKDNNNTNEPSVSNNVDEPSVSNEVSNDPADNKDNNVDEPSVSNEINANVDEPSVSNEVNANVDEPTDEKTVDEPSVSIDSTDSSSEHSNVA